MIAIRPSLAKVDLRRNNEGVNVKGRVVGIYRRLFNTLQRWRRSWHKITQGSLQTSTCSSYTLYYIIHPADSSLIRSYYYDNEWLGKQRNHACNTCQHNCPHKNPLTIILRVHVELPVLQWITSVVFTEHNKHAPLFVIYDHTDVPPAPCMTKHDVAAWYIVTIMYSIPISKIDFKAAHNLNSPTKNRVLKPKIITSKTSVKSANT